MKRLPSFIAALLFLPALGQAEDIPEAPLDLFIPHVTRTGGLEILHAWTRATGRDTAQIFMEITNVSRNDLTLRGGRTEIGGAVRVMATSYAGEVEIVDIGAFPIKSRSKIDLSPGGLFLDVSDLDIDLTEGMSFEMHVEIDPIGAVKIIVEVERADALTHSHAGHSH